MERNVMYANLLRLSDPSSNRLQKYNIEVNKQT